MAVLGTLEYLSLQNFLIFVVLSFISSILLMYMFLMVTTIREPDLRRSQQEKEFMDPKTGHTLLFPHLRDPPSVLLSVIVPSYKEGERLPKMMEETMGYLEERQKKLPSFTYEVIIVDDGSPDGGATSKAALKYVEEFGVDKVRLLKFDHNRGKGGAVRMGMLSARGERLLMVDADGATLFKDIERLELEMDKVAPQWTSPAISVGSRAHLQEDAVANRSLFRNFLMYGFHFLVYVLCVKGIKDTQCGFKLFTRAAARTIFPNLHVERWAFDVEVLYIAQKLSIPVAEVAVNWEEIEGTKMVPFWSWAQMGKDLVFIRMRYMFGLWKIQPSKKQD